MKLFPNSHTDGDGGYKVYHNFTLETNDGDVFTLYDWKLYKDVGLDTQIEFHIGGDNDMITEKALRELEDLLFFLYL